MWKVDKVLLENERALMPIVLGSADELAVFIFAESLKRARSFRTDIGAARRSAA
jgi:hypothetical protein